MTSIILIIATFLTSVVSGLLSMACGMILMGVFGFLLSVPAAMVLHGIAQAFSNGSRVWLYRHHIRWGVLLPYAAGALLVLATFYLILFIPNIGLVFILIGSFPFITLILPKAINLDIQRKPVSFLAGVIVTTAQMLAGASGPVLDVFYVKSSLTRQEILGSKAITQTLGHLLKLVYYGPLLATASEEFSIWLIPTVVVAAMFGNWTAAHFVARISDAHFKKAGRIIIIMIGLVYIGKGISELFFT